MTNDKNHLYSKDDISVDLKNSAKRRTQQPFSRFSIAASNAINVANTNSTTKALQIQTKPQIGDPINDTYGTVNGATTIPLDVWGSNYSVLTINGDVDFVFDKIPQGRHIIFTVDFLVSTGTPPVVNLDARVKNPPTLPTLNNGDRVILHFEGVVDDTSTRFVFIGGTVNASSVGSQTPWLSNIDAAKFLLQDLGGIEFRDSTQLKITPVDTSPPDGTYDRLEYDADVNGAHDFYVDRTNEPIPRLGITIADVNSNVPVNIFNNNLSPSSNVMVLQITAGNEALIDTDASIWNVGVGGATRLILDVTTQTNLELASPSGSGGTTNLDLVAKHASDPDNAFSFTMPAGSAAVAQIATSQPIMTMAAGGATRVTLDTSVNTVLTLESPGAVPTLQLFRNDGTPNDNDTISLLQFQGKDDVGTTTTYAQFEAISTDVTNATEDATLILSLITNGVLGSTSITYSANTVEYSTIEENPEGFESIFYRNDSSPNDDDVLAQFTFDGNDSGGTRTTYAEIRAISTDVTDTTEDGAIAIRVRNGGSLRTAMTIHDLFINTHVSPIQMEVTTTPANPAAGEIYVYSKSDGGIAKLFYKQSDGTEVGPLGAGGAGASDKIEEGNSKVEVIDTGTGRVDVFIDDLTTAKYTFSAAAFSPKTAGVVNLGSATLPWGELVTRSVEIETGGTLTSNNNEIVSDSGGMILNVPTGDQFEFSINGNVANGGLIIGDNLIQFGESGRQHEINANGTSIDIIAENTSDGVKLWPGAGRSNEAVIVQDINTILKNSTTGSAYQLLIQYSNSTTTGQPAIGNIGFQAEDSANVQSAYAGIVTAIDDDTSTGRDGRMQLVVALNNGTTERSVTALTGIGIDIHGDSGTLKIGFFGATPVAKQNPSVTAAAIHAALQAYGLFV